MAKVLAEVLLYVFLVALGFILFQSDAARAVLVVVGSASITSVLVQRWRTTKSPTQST